jgi:molybdenum-dependent DNA-binding transcriptional regulator ModE
MGKALLGTHVTPGSLRLLDEVRALRARVEELERALAEAEAARDARAEQDASETVVRVDDREPART